MPDLEPFFNRGTDCVIPRQEIPDAARLRLDSQLYMYEVSRNGSAIRLMEAYAIKGGPVIVQEIGMWHNSDEGLQIYVPLVWERRSDLRGTTLVNGILPYGVYNDVHTKENGDVEATSGAFADLLEAMRQEMNFNLKQRLSSDGKWGGKVTTRTFDLLFLSEMGLQFADERRQILQRSDSNVA